MPLLLCLSHLRWNFVWQRPQHLMTSAARGFRVLFIEEPVEDDVFAPAMSIEDRPEGVRVACPRLPRGLNAAEKIAAQRGLIEDCLAAEDQGARVLWYYTPAALEFTDHLPRGATVYDNMDELAAFKGASPELIGLEERLLARADVVFTGGHSLYEAKRHRHDNISAEPSSIDTRHFWQARRTTQPEPADQAAIARPRIGFFGVIDERLDVDLVAAVADLRNDWQFVMLGPVVKIDPSSLPVRPNLHWLGQKTYAELPAYLAGWDAGVMPFALNEATRFISPTKTPEFLAAGVPVVSTPIRDVVRPYGDKGLVAIARTAEEMVAALSTIMSRRPAERTSWLDGVDRHLSAGSWEQTFERMNARIEAVLARRAVPRAALIATVATMPPRGLPAAE